MSSSHMLGAMLLAAASLGMRAESPGDIAERLSAATPYRAGARYEVLLPQSENPVVYTVNLTSFRPEAADTLSPCDYLLQWSMDTPSGQSSGFNAYFAGHHYRFRDKRMQEYHHDDSPMDFSPQGNVRNGVQQQAQFASLLPAYIALQLKDMEHNPGYIYTISSDSVGKTTVIEGVQRINGYDGMEYKYVFGTDDGLPRAAEICYNPGQMSEQSVSVRYSAPGTESISSPLSEPKLMSLYPEAFGRYRESGYTLANLPGRPLPAIAAPTLSGERYFHACGEAFGTPAIIALLDTEVDGCGDMINSLRSAVDASPVSTALIMAFTSKHADTIAHTVGQVRPGETVLTRASGIARDCGATATPVVIVCGADGNVKNVHTGRNKDIAAIVMQEISIK